MGEEVKVEEKKEVLTREERAQATLEVIEEIKPPSLLKWHLLFFLTGAAAGTGITALIRMLVR